MKKRVKTRGSILGCGGWKRVLSCPQASVQIYTHIQQVTFVSFFYFKYFNQNYFVVISFQIKCSVFRPFDNVKAFDQILPFLLVQFFFRSLKISPEILNIKISYRCRETLLQSSIPLDFLCNKYMNTIQQLSDNCPCFN